MTPKLKVISKVRETLKTTQNNRTMRNLLASLALLFASFAAMSFQTDDTTRFQNGTQTTSTGIPTDSCCTITFMNGNQKITVTRINAIQSSIQVNNMDIQTWVNSLMAYTYKKLNTQVVRVADVRMDSQFTKEELRIRQQAITYSKKTLADASEMDEELNNQFQIKVVIPEFGKMLRPEITDADAGIDALVNDDELRKLAAVEFSKTLNTRSEDAHMDLMINAGTLKNVKSNATNAADLQLDQLVNFINQPSIHPSLANEADKNMDELMRR